MPASCFTSPHLTLKLPRVTDIRPGIGYLDQLLRGVGHVSFLLVDRRSDLNGHHDYRIVRAAIDEELRRTATLLVNGPNLLVEEDIVCWRHGVEPMGSPCKESGSAYLSDLSRL